MSFRDDPFAGAYATRRARLRERLGPAGVDALLVTQATNILYLSGFRGSSGALVIAADGDFLLTDFRYHERVRHEADPTVTLVDESGKDRLGAVVPSLVDQLGTRRLGFESEELSYAGHARLARGLATAACGAPVPVAGLVAEMRTIKEPAEVQAIRSAVALGERVFTEVAALAVPGAIEADLAAEVEYRARKYGASACSFSPIIASGPRGAQPHAGFTREAILPGVPLVIDMGVILADYCSDMTRTVFPGECPPTWRELYALVREAKDAAFARIRPGVATREVDAIAREIISRAGHGDRFGHGLGHGVGLPFKGGPILHWTSDDILAPGHVASCEPGIYLPHEGGIRIEDLFVVTADGAENLNRLDTALLVTG